MFLKRRSPIRGAGSRPAVAAILVAVALAGLGSWILLDSNGSQGRRHVVVDGVPLDVVHPAGLRAGERRPGVVVAHGFAGSARLMAPFGDTLAARGYVVVLLDFSGHGTDTRPLPDGTASTDASATALELDLDVAVTHLRGLSDVDPARIALVGHSMGATAVTRYAVDHPEVAATVAISLPDSSQLPPDRPARLLLLVGGAEFPGFRAAAEQAVAAGGAGRTAVVVPGVEHISILYAPRTHREVVTWLDGTFGGPLDTAPVPLPLRRLAAGGLLLLAFLAGLFPVAQVLLGGRGRAWPRVEPAMIGRTVAVAAGAALVAVLVVPLAPTGRLPLALGGYIVGFTGVTGAVMLAYLRWRPIDPASATIPRLRLAVAAPALVAYAAVAIALPLELGVTNAVPTGARWWLLGLVWAGFAVLAYAAEKLAGGNSFGGLAVSAVAVVALTGAIVVGLAPGFLLLVVPLFAVLLTGQAIWGAVLHRFSAPAWLVALAGSLIVAWPIATALPVTG